MSVSEGLVEELLIGLRIEGIKSIDLLTQLQDQLDQLTCNQSD